MCCRLGPCGKCCLACTVLLIVVVAVAVPLGIFVVGPKIAQHILDTTTIELPNSTMAPCSTLEAEVINFAKINVPSALGSTLHSSTQKLSTTTCGTGPNMQGGYACSNPNVSELGTYVSPALDLSGGENEKNFSVRMDLKSTDTVISGFIVPMFMNEKKAHLTVTAEDVTVSVLGIKFGGLKMHNEFTCTGVQILDDSVIPNWVCYPNNSSHAPDTANFYYMNCVAGKLPLNEPTTTTAALTATTTTTTVRNKSHAEPMIVT